MQALAQQLWQGKPVKDILATADARLKTVVKD